MSVILVYPSYTNNSKSCYQLHSNKNSISGQKNQKLLEIKTQDMIVVSTAFVHLYCIIIWWLFKPNPNNEPLCNHLTNKLSLSEMYLISFERAGVTSRE